MNNQKELINFLNTNKKAWNNKTLFHLKSEFYDVEGFKEGKSSLKFIELEELGDVKNKTMLHLQCHFGQDSLSWARMGAKVTGVDFSDEAIKAARSLNNELNLDAKFICSYIYDIKEHLDEKFDIVFTSYGTIGWLPELKEWGRLILHYLKPGGIFYIVEFHTVLWMFDDDFKNFKYSYFNQGEIEEEVEGTYADMNAPLKQKEYGWNHPLSEVINSLIENGLQIEFLHEFPFSVYDVFSNSVKGKYDWWRIKGMENIIPMMFSIKAKL
ncbi:MAG: class I SAM-dependent methyltransferase [Ignavibacteriaceae bacterium]